MEKLNSNKNLNTNLLNAAQQVLITRNNIKLLMKKCTSVAQQLERAVAAGAGVKEQPRSLSSSYVNWIYYLLLNQRNFFFI